MDKQKKKSVYLRTALQVALLIFSVVALVIGICGGEANEIMHKAVVVCMECIGIG